MAYDRWPRDRPPRPGEIAAVFNAAFSAFEDERRCFRATRVMGSMLVFDFGRQLPARGRMGREVAVGSGTLSVGNVYWWVSGSQRRLNSEVLDEALVQTLQDTFVGHDLLTVEATAKALRFHFTGEVSLNLDLTNLWSQAPDDEVCVLGLDRLSVTLSTSHKVRLRPAGDYRQAA